MLFRSPPDLREQDATDDESDEEPPRPARRARAKPRPRRGAPTMATLRTPRTRHNPRPARATNPVVRTHYTTGGVPDATPQHFKTVTWARSFLQLPRLEQQHNMIPVEDAGVFEYSDGNANLVASLMYDIHSGVQCTALSQINALLIEVVRLEINYQFATILDETLIKTCPSFAPGYSCSFV